MASIWYIWASLVAPVVKKLPAKAGNIGRLDPRVGKIPGKKAWQPTPVFLPGESPGQRNLVGYGPWGHKESDMPEVTKQLTIPLPDR